jgi:capsular polysaccharide biosynthesis protein
MATERSAELGDYSLLLRRQWWVVVLTLLVTTGLALTYTALASPEYTSTTSVLVTPTGSPSQTTSSTRAGETINMDTEAQIITSTEVVIAVAEALGHTVDVQELAERVTIAVPPNTEILDISYTGPSAAQARQGAEAFAIAYLVNRGTTAENSVEAEQATLQARIDDLDARLASVTEATAALPEDSAARAYNEAQASGLNDQLGDLNAQLNELNAFRGTPGEIITRASLPTAPSSPQGLLTVAAGALLGLLAGVGLAVLRERSDQYIRRAADVERRVDLPLLAEMPSSMDLEHVELATAASPEGRSYTRLRNVVTAGAQHEARVVLVAGVSGPAGPVAANLAASLARSGDDTVLVCGDVHAETETDLLGGTNGVGLAEVLAGRASAGEAMRRLPGLPELHVLGPGTDRDRAAELLQTSGPRDLLGALLEVATWVVIEAPATTDGADAQTLARFSDLAVLVVQVNGTTAQEIVDARDQFESMRTPVLGAVVVPARPRERTRQRLWAVSAERPGRTRSGNPALASARLTSPLPDRSAQAKELPSLSPTPSTGPGRPGGTVRTPAGADG